MLLYIFFRAGKEGAVLLTAVFKLPQRGIFLHKLVRAFIFSDRHGSGCCMLYFPVYNMQHPVIKLQLILRYQALE